MSCISVRPQFSKLIWNGNGGISLRFEHCNYQNLIVVCSLVVHLPMLLLEVFELWRCDYKHKYRSNDQAEDKESKLLIH